MGVLNSFSYLAVGAIKVCQTVEPLGNGGHSSGDHGDYQFPRYVCWWCVYVVRLLLLFLQIKPRVPTSNLRVQQRRFFYWKTYSNFQIKSIALKSFLCMQPTSVCLPLADRKHKRVPNTCKNITVGNKTFYIRGENRRGLISAAVVLAMAYLHSYQCHVMESSQSTIE